MLHTQVTSMRRVLGVLLAAGAATVLFALPVWAADPSRMIETVAAEIIEIAKTKTGADRQAAMRQVVEANFDRLRDYARGDGAAVQGYAVRVQGLQA